MRCRLHGILALPVPQLSQSAARCSITLKSASVIYRSWLSDTLVYFLCTLVAMLQLVPVRVLEPFLKTPHAVLS
jgi:hypothetical protein